MDPIRVGVVYYSAGQRVPVEKGFRVIGHTTHDSRIGQQTFFWPSLAKFEADGGKVTPDGRVIWPKELFEGGGIHRPVPVMEAIDPDAERQKIEAAEASSKIKNAERADFEAGMFQAEKGMALVPDASEAMRRGYESVAKPEQSTTPPDASGTESQTAP